MTVQYKTINYTDFIPSNLGFTEVEENERTKGQLIGFHNYLIDGTNFNIEIQTPWLELITYGIPILNEKTQQYYDVESKRAKIKIPLDLNNPEILLFAQKIKEIDELMDTPEMKQKILGKNLGKNPKKYEKYSYSSIFREPNDEENIDDDKPKSKFITPPFINVKLDIEYQTNKLQTKVFEKSTENGKIIRNRLDHIDTIDGLGSILKYKSKFRAIIKPFKIWATSPKTPDLKWGISLRLTRIEIEKGSGASKNVNTSEEFLDSDDEALEKIINKSPETDEKKSKTIEIDDDESDEDENKKEDKKETENNNEDKNEDKNEDNSDDNSDDDDDSEDDIKVEHKSNTEITQKKIVEIDDDSDESDEEDIEVAKPVEIIKKKETKVSKQKKDNDSDDEIEVKKPIKETKKPKSKYIKEV
jgi:hypothetical protein